MHGTISLLKKLKNGDRNLVSRPWEDLPKDVMEKIGLNLNSTDYIHASVVCKSWLSLLKSDISRPQIPWILLPHQSDGHSLKFFNFLEAKYHILRLPKGLEGGYILGSSKGWLVVVLRKRRRSGWYHVYLLNPISGVKCTLPPLPNYISLQRVEISSSNASRCTVAAIVNNSKELAFYQPEYCRWKVVPLSSRVSRVGEDCSLVDILFCRRKLHILVNSLSGKGKIEDVNVKLPNYGGTIPVTLIHDLPEMPPSNIGRRISLRYRRISYLVESTEGRVMLIHKHQLNEEASDYDEEDEEEYSSEEGDDHNRYYNEEDDDDDGYYNEEDDYDEDEGEGYTEEEDDDEEDYSEYSEEEDDDEYEEDDDNNESDEIEDDHTDGDEDEEFDRDELSSLNGFRVYKMTNLGGKKRLCKKKGLGKEQAMFLSYKSRSCLHVTSDLIQENSIYFGMGYANEDDGENSFLVNFSGMYDLDCFTIQPLIPTFDYGWNPQSMWFVPSLLPVTHTMTEHITLSRYIFLLLTNFISISLPVSNSFS